MQEVKRKKRCLLAELRQGKVACLHKHPGLAKQDLPTSSKNLNLTTKKCKSLAQNPRVVAFPAEKSQSQKYTSKARTVEDNFTSARKTAIAGRATESEI